MKNSIKIPPFHYIHVLDRNTNVTRLESGPQAFIRQDHEKIVTGDSPIKMIILPPRTYCEINDPAIIGKDGAPVLDKFGQVCIKHGEFEVRLDADYPDPFPLYPGESLKTAPTALLVVKENTALRLEATRNFEKNGNKIVAGDEWLFYGPNTYYPRIEERIVAQIESITIGEQQALRLKARQDFTDRAGIKRKTGEEWLIRQSGSYLPDINEIVVGIIKAYTLNNQTAVQVRAIKSFTDFYNCKRKAGEEWLITREKSSYHILDVFEEYVSTNTITVLRKNEYCYVNDPVDPKTNKNKLGTKSLRQGESSFFLQPGETHDGVKSARVLQEDQALLLKAQEAFKDEDGNERKPGDKWMVQGPRVYIPPTQVQVIEFRNRVPLDKNEGVYVRDIRTGVIRCEYGQSYMLKAHEEFYVKELTETEEKLIAKNFNIAGFKRDKTRVITFRCPFNHAVQVYDYKAKKSRVILGPGLVLLGPDEQFTVSALSGGTPKRPGVVNTLSINLGPDFSTDIVNVETSDHTRLNLTLAYNWQFLYDPNDQTKNNKVFEVRDFIGNLCNQMASKIRSVVATVAFDEFHKNSAKIIRKSIFGLDANGKIKPSYLFETNNLSVTNVDIQSVEPADKITLENLQKAVTQAIEISTKSLEAHYKYQSDMMEQQAQGQLDKAKIDFQAKAEESKKRLMEVQADSQAIQSTGKAKAEAKSKAEAAEIESQTKVKIAEMKASARKILLEAELDKKTTRQKIEIDHDRQINKLEIDKARALSSIEADKFDAIISALGKETLVSLANAGPQYQVELLKGLNLEGYIMTDGNNPINLYDTATGMIGSRK